MSTIHQRCYALYKNKMIDAIPDTEKQMAIGKIVLQKFKDQTGGKYPGHAQEPESMGKFKVRYYPAFFTPEIDESILYFLCGIKKKRKSKKVVVER